MTSMNGTYTQVLPNGNNISIYLHVYLPNVELRLLTNFPLHNLIMKLDLPTAASPANTTLYIRSGSFIVFVFSTCK